MQTIRHVLSIDGGGIRGITPAYVIAHLESESGKPASELFDLMVGTSTGGILALSLTVSTPFTSLPMLSSSLAPH